MSAPLSSIAGKLGKLVPRLGSDHDGEVIAVVRAIQRTLAGAGLDLHDLATAIERPPIVVTAAPARPQRQHAARQSQPKQPVNGDLYRTAAWCSEQAERLSQKEADFIRNVCLFMSSGNGLSDRQTKWLQDIAQRLLRMAGAA